MLPLDKRQSTAAIRSCPPRQFISPRDTRIAALWAQLQKLAEHAYRTNKANGSLIHTRMDHNRCALTALKVAPPEANCKPACDLGTIERYVLTENTLFLVG
ncbi:flagellar export chaperone FlgN [Paraburkholderia fynbosensis]|uniref:flagellar export chaperone FlgN n=1 Tax=Paraburkholderia fynbosensis TaxID=1200993 RepID=UPI001583E0F1